MDLHQYLKQQEAKKLSKYTLKGYRLVLLICRKAYQTMQDIAKDA